MLWLAGLMGAALAAMVLIHLARPRMESRRVSARRFFRDLPPISRSARRWRWNPPPMTPAFWLRVGVLALLLASLLSLGIEWRAAAVEVSGVAVLLDTSASLSTRLPQGGTRFQQALRRLEEILQQAAESSEAACFRLLAFDLEVREAASGSRSEVLAAARGLTPRALGTNLDLVRQSARRLLEGGADTSAQPSGGGSAGSDSAASCPVGAVVAVSDRPAPEWAGELSAWADVGRPADNAGFTVLSSRRDPLTGRVDEILAELAAWGTPPAGARLRIQAPDGSLPLDQPITWTRGRATVRFAPSMPGLYRLLFTPPDAYSLDNQAAVDIPPPRRLQVEWGIEASQVLERLGWEAVPARVPLPDNRGGNRGGNRRQTADRQGQTVETDLRVLPVEALSAADSTQPGPLSSGDSAGRPGREESRQENPASRRTVPVLYVGSGYSPRRTASDGGSSQISDFRESSPLLRELHFDVAERMGIAAPSRTLPASFSPVLRGTGGTWIALRDDPPAVYIPGPPLGTDDDPGRFSATVFFNAVRHLLGRRSLPPLHTLTSPTHPIADGSRLTLHDGEGNTSYRPRSTGNLQDLSASATRTSRAPLWPALLLLSAALFLWERLRQT